MDLCDHMNHTTFVSILTVLAEVQAHNAGQTTWVLMRAADSTGRRRITCKVSGGQRTRPYENHSRSAEAGH